MSRWRDFLDGVEPKRDLENLLETIEAELKELKARSLTEEARLLSIRNNLTEARLKVKKLKHENSVLKNKVSILEEDLDLQETFMYRLYDSIEELVLEFEDEDSEPVGGRTIAIVPGAFKPPHLGHLSMVKQYASEADEVVILVSSPLKASRGIGGKPISAQQSKQIWELLLADQGLSNVRVEISPKPSPVTATFEYVDEEGPLEPGTRLVLGASQKGGDFKRWKSAAKYVKPGVELLPPEQTAVIPANRPSGESYSATDARKMLEQGENADEFFGDGRTEDVRSILGLDSSLEEMSAMGGGAVAGYGAPIAMRKQKKKKQNEYNELYLYKEVLRLLMKEGITK